jgi:uncharacterized protein
MTLRPERYIQRVVDRELDELFEGPGGAQTTAVVIEGAKAVGKTATAAQRSDVEFQLERPEVRAVVEGDPEQVVRPGRVLIDEWQRVPATWDAVRRAVDARANAQFLLTGSLVPHRPETHSGAGRMITVKMRPLSLAERGLGQPTVSLRELLSGRRAELHGECELGFEEYADEIVGSGFPGTRDEPWRRREALIDAYVDRVIDRDFEDAGVAVRNPALLRRWLAAYAAATSQTTTLEKIRDAASPGVQEKPARTTIHGYRDVLQRLHILEPVPAWIPSHNQLRQLAASPKHQLVDPALAVALLDLDAEALVAGEPTMTSQPKDGSFFGSLFESLVTQSVRVYAQQARATVSHMRTHGNPAREVDLIVEGRGGKVLAIEVKLARSIKDDHVQQLRWLRDQLGSNLLDAIVVNAGPGAYRRADGFGVVPAALLSP